MNISSEIDAKADEIIAQFPQKKSAAMLMMHLIQEAYGHFDDDAINYIAKKLEVEPVHVYGMMSFYPMFSKEQKGAVHIKVCRTLSCALAGSINLAHSIAKNLDMEVGETKGVYTIEFVECVGNCVNAPNVHVNDKLFDKVNPERVEKFVEEIKSMKEAGLLEPKNMFDKAQGENFDSAEYKG